MHRTRTAVAVAALVASTAGAATAAATTASAQGPSHTRTTAARTTPARTTAARTTAARTTAARTTAARTTAARTTAARTTAARRHERLVRPQHVEIDRGLSKRRAELSLRRIRELYTFWDTGDTRYLHRADSPSFVDHTLPAGRPQGLVGIEQASRTFRAAVPDLRCTVADVLITGERASVRQVYSGHFTGTYDGVRGHGQRVRFIAFDIQQLGRWQSVGDWHLEDNLTFLRQIGAVQ